MKKNLGKILLIVVPIIAALIILLPTYEAVNLEKLEMEAKRKAKNAKSPADSLKIIQDFYSKYGEELTAKKSQRLQLGLDLKGGMYVTLEVDLLKMLEETAQQEAIDETFKDVLAKTKEDLKASDENTLDIFLENFANIAKPKGKSLISYYDIGDLKEVSEEKIIESLRKKADDAIEQAKEVISQRIDKYGVSEPNIQSQGSRRIVLELPGVTDETQMRKLLSTTARLEFKLVRNNLDAVKAFMTINNYLAGESAPADTVPAKDTAALAADTAKAKAVTIVEKGAKDKKKDAKAKKDTASVAAADTAKKADTATNKPFDKMNEAEKEAFRKEYMKTHKFTSLFATMFVPEGENAQPQMVDYTTTELPQGRYIFRVGEQDMARIKEIVSRPEIKAIMPYDMEVAFSVKGEKNKAENGRTYKVYDMYMLKAEAELLGDVITDAMKNVDPQTNGWIVEMRMNADGADKWGAITGANVGKQIAIVLDGGVYTAPNVINKISGGISQISGMANAEEASLIEIILKAGALKAPVKIMEERVVGASLGEDSIATGVTASWIAALLVVLYMIMYYKRGGVVADFAVLVNILLVIATLATLHGTLTLPGIAGLILTFGMAVDANVLIYERIREELAKGKTLRFAVDEGFKRAMSAIIDSHVTTFITGMILYYLGTGPIKGFALTLIIGILSTLFTAIYVSKAMINISIANGATSYDFGQPNAKSK